MKRREFVQLLQQRLLSKSDDDKRMFESMSRRQVECILDALFEAIIEVAGDGGEVRLKHGTFHPKVMQSDQELVNVRLGFRSFKLTNRSLFDAFSQHEMPGLKVGKFCEVYSTNGSSRVVNEDGRELYSMTEISSMSGVSLPTCYRYVKQPWFRGDPKKGVEGVAQKLNLVVKNSTGKRYDPQVADIFRARKEGNETKVKGRIELGDDKVVFALSRVSRDTGISVQSLHRLVREHKIKKARHPLLPDDRDFYDKESVETMMAARGVDAVIQ